MCFDKLDDIIFQSRYLFHCDRQIERSGERKQKPTEKFSSDIVSLFLSMSSRKKNQMYKT